MLLYNNKKQNKVKKKKKTFFEILYLVVFQFFIQKHYTLLFYESNFIRTKTSILTIKQEQAKKKSRLAVPQNIRAKYLG